VWILTVSVLGELFANFAGVFFSMGMVGSFSGKQFAGGESRGIELNGMVCGDGELMVFDRRGSILKGCI
jgi:hypothetical protein